MNTVHLKFFSMSHYTVRLLISLFGLLLAVFPSLLNAQSFGGGVTGHNYDMYVINQDGTLNQSSALKLEGRYIEGANFRYNNWFMLNEADDQNLYFINKTNAAGDSEVNLGNNIMTLTSSGFMGIGSTFSSTSSPTSPLHIKRTGGMDFLKLEATDSKWVGIIMKGPREWRVHNNGDSYTIEDRTAGAGTRLQIDKDGNLNVGQGDDKIFGKIGNAKVGRVHSDTEEWTGLSHLSVGDAEYAILQNDEGATYLNGASDQYVGFRLGNADKMRLTKEGYFGIGLTAPTSLLHVSGASSGGAIRISPASDGGEATMGFYEDADAKDGDRWVIGLGGWGNTDDFIFGFSDGVSSGVRALMEQDGDFGLGTTAPKAKLHIYGGNDAGMPDAQSGFAMFGDIDGENLIMDEKEIMARNDGSKSTLFLQNNGGEISVHGSQGNGSQFIIKDNGKVAIGTTSIPAGYKLALEGKMIARGVVVDADGWADYVFEDAYELPSLESVGEYIQENGHLPEVPTTAEVEENGVNVAQMQTTLLKKVEEMTLYMLEVNEQVKSLKQQVADLEAENAALKK